MPRRLGTKLCLSCKAILTGSNPAYCDSKCENYKKKS